MKKETWFGLNIYAKLEVDNLRILYSEDAVVLLGKNLEEKKNYINFYLCLIYLTERNVKIDNTFGIFTDFGVDMIRMKIKKNFIENINETNVLYLLESTNRGAYYTNKEDTRELIGIQLDGVYSKLTQEELEEEFVNILEVLAEKRKKVKIYTK